MPRVSSPAFADLPPAVAALFEAAGEATFFSTLPWYDVYARTALPAGAAPVLYTDDANRPTIALVGQTSAEAPRELFSLANFYSVEHGLAGAPGADLASATARLVDGIVAEQPLWQRLTLGPFDVADAGFAALVAACRRRALLVECFLDSGTWYEDTHGMSFADYLAARPSELRNTWRRKLRKTSREASLGKAFFDGPARIEEGIAAYETIYRASWKQAEGSPHFVPELMRVAAGQGALRLGVYSVDGQPAAAQFWIVWRGRAVIYKLAHDERFDELSLGTLLTMEMMERALERDRPVEVTFGRGDDPYKRLWLPRRRERWSFRAANPRTARGLALGLKREAAKLYHRWRGVPVDPFQAAPP
jgi:Acetyltransferase (GNAT) domain